MASSLSSFRFLPFHWWVLFRPRIRLLPERSAWEDQTCETIYSSKLVLITQLGPGWTGWFPRLIDSVAVPTTPRISHAAERGGRGQSDKKSQNFLTTTQLASDPSELPTTPPGNISDGSGRSPAPGSAPARRAARTPLVGPPLSLSSPELPGDLVRLCFPGRASGVGAYRQLGNDGAGAMSLW